MYTDDVNVFNNSSFAKINYTSQPLANSIQVVPHAILLDIGIKDYLIEVHTIEAYQKMFFKNTKGDVPFDLFGASFWLMARYEEYLPFKANKYNVFDYRSSLAWQNEFLNLPLINIWMAVFIKQLTALFPQLQLKENKYTFVTTIDIDSVYKYKHKGTIRSIAGIYKDLISRNFSQLKNRIKTLFFNQLDEFDCYQFLIDTNKKYNSKAICFFLLGDYNINDKNHSANNPHFQTLIKHLADYAKAGIHPSFASNFNIKQLKIEVFRLASITHAEVTHARQHFGMLIFPKTYMALQQAGIKHDYSLGYTNKNGFRASICYPIKWYNITNEEETSLTLHPFCLTDVELNKKLSETSDEDAITCFEVYYQHVLNFKGEFTIVFHNDMLANTKNGLRWRNLYEQFLAKANP